MTPVQKFKQKMWRAIYPIFPRLEHRFVFLHNKGRQKYHIGWLKEGKTLAELKQHLSTQGFGNHFVAWEDADQVLSWRRLASFNEQYHIRVFKDGEIRGHFEITPEAHPLEHFFEKGETPRTDDFLKFLGSFVTLKKYVSHLEIDTSVPVPDSELTYQEYSQ